MAHREWPSREELRKASGSEFTGLDTFGLQAPPPRDHPRYRTLRTWRRVFYGMGDELPGLIRADARFLHVTLTSADLSFEEAARSWSGVARRMRERWPDLVYLATRDRGKGKAGFHIHAVMFRPVPQKADGRGGWSIQFDDIEWLRDVAKRHGFGSYVDVQGRERGDASVPHQMPGDRMRLLNYVWNSAASLTEHRDVPRATIFFASQGIGPSARRRTMFPLRDVGSEN